MNDTYEKAKSLAEKYHQEHLLRFYDELSPSEQESLVNQILSIDFDLMDSLYRNLILNPQNENTESHISPLKSHDWEAFSEEDQSKFFDLGMETLKNGKAAALLVAGGQGTRLGHVGPKGTYDIGLPSGKSFFQLQCERLLNLSRQAGRYIPWYIMTSYENHTDTVSFFESHSYFGYDPKEIFFFRQDMLPVLDIAGKILMEGKGAVSMGPNGNGGVFLSCEKSGALTDMKRRGVEWVFLYGIDNALVKVADPHFLGFTIHSGCPSASKVVEKNKPDERVGVLCYRNSRPAIVEYTELPESLAQEQDGRGRLIYNNANIVNHLFRIKYLEQNTELSLPYHVAFKKMGTIDDRGNAVQVDSPNAYKFELFMFDLFPLLPDMAALKVAREEEFAPVKNKSGEDSPDTARRLILSLHRQWLLEAGVKPELLEGQGLEVSPLVSYGGEGISKEKAEELLRG